MEAQPEQCLADVRPAPRLRGALELRDVCFRYAVNAPDVLHGISLAVEPGQKVAIVGRTGSGKSTLASLFVALQVPTAGDVLFDGVNLRGMELSSLRDQIGIVLQDIVLFSGSIRQNVTLSDTEIPLDRVVDACKLAGIHDDISLMPMNYETLLAEGGKGLSGGQLQRLALARALVREPALLVLDEATSHLDTETESAIEAHLSSLACTRIVVAHRMSTVRNADVILVLESGRIVQRGTHSELARVPGVYAELIRGQLSEDETAIAPTGLGGTNSRSVEFW
jgi:ATP-binding cassette subfamily B protein